MKPLRCELTPPRPDIIAHAGLSPCACTRRAGIRFSTLMGGVHPHQRGGMQFRTAWLLAHAYREIARSGVPHPHGRSLGGGGVCTRTHHRTTP